MIPSGAHWLSSLYMLPSHILFLSCCAVLFPSNGRTGVNLFIAM